VAQTLGQQYDSLLLKIQKAESSQSYSTLSGESLTRGQLPSLYAERNRLIAKIEYYGRNYIEGQNTAPIGDTSFVSFVE